MATSLTLQSAEVQHDGRLIRLVFSGATPATRGAVDWFPGWLANVARSLSTNAAFYFSGGSPVVNGGNLEWHVRLVIRTPSDRIVFGQSGITISAGAGFLQDEEGNATAAFTNFAVTNYSYVNSSGFRATITPSGGAVTRYVSYTNGNDANPGTELQPWKTLSYAQTQLYDTGHGSDGSQCLLLEGDRWPVGVDFSWNQGASFDRPFVLGHYWHDYGTGGVGTGQQGVRPSIRPSNGALGLLRTGGAGRPASLSYVIVDGLDCSFPTSNGDSGSGGLICQMFDSHWMLIDCRTQGGVTGIEITGNGSGFADHMSVVRPIILDTYEQMGSGLSSTGSGLHIAKVTNMLVSEPTIDRCGYQEPTLTYGGTRSRNFYPDVSVPHLAYWGGFNTRSSSEAVQVRGGGDVFGVIIDDCSQAGFIQHGGGRIAMSITLRTRDANYWNTTTLAGYSVPLGWNWYVGYDSGSHSVSQDGVDGAMEGCIIECCGAGTSLSTASGRCFSLNWNNTPGSQSRHIYRNNTAVNTMMVYYSGDGATYLPARFTTTNNLCSISATPFNCLNHVAASYVSYAWMENDANCYHSSNAAKVVVMNSDGTNYTLAAYTTLTGQEATSIQTAPTFVNANAGLGDWYASVGGSNSVSAFYELIRNRAMGQWPNGLDSLAAARFFLSQFQATNIPALTPSSVLGMYGAPLDDPSYLNPAAATISSPTRRPRMSRLLKQSESTSARRRVSVYLVDATDGFTPETLVSPSASEIKVSKNGGAFANYAGTFTELGGGAYYYEFTAAELDTLGFVLLKITKSGIRDFIAEVQVVPFDPNDSVRLGVTALPNAAAEAAGGLFTRGTGAGQINQTVNGTIVSNIVAGGITSGAFGTGAITSASIADGALVNAKFGSGAIAAANIATGAITSAKFADGAISFAAFAADAIDNGVISLTAAAQIAASIWDKPRNQHTIVGTFGHSVAAVAGNVGGSVVGDVGGSVASISANGISSSSFAAGAITAAKFAADAIDSNAIAATGVSKIVAGVSASTHDGITFTSIMELVLAVFTGKVTVVDNGTTRTMTFKKRDGVTTKLVMTAAEADGSRAAVGTIS